MDLDNVSKNTHIYEETEDYIILDNEQTVSYTHLRAH